MSGTLHKIPSTAQYERHGRLLVGTLQNTLDQLSDIGNSKYGIKNGDLYAQVPFLGFLGVTRKVRPLEARNVASTISEPIFKRLEGIERSWRTLDETVKENLVDLTTSKTELEEELASMYALIARNAKSALKNKEKVTMSSIPDAVDPLDPSYAKVMMQRYFSERDLMINGSKQKTHVRVGDASLGVAESMQKELLTHNAYYAMLLDYHSILEVFCAEAKFMVESARLNLLEIVGFWELAYDSAQACRGREELSEINGVLSGVIKDRTLNAKGLPTSKLLTFDE